MIELNRFFALKIPSAGAPKVGTEGVGGFTYVFVPQQNIPFLINLGYQKVVDANTLSLFASAGYGPDLYYDPSSPSIIYGTYTPWA